jgi:hypothetical protein
MTLATLGVGHEGSWIGFGVGGGDDFRRRRPLSVARPLRCVRAIAIGVVKGSDSRLDRLPRPIAAGCCQLSVALTRIRCTSKKYHLQIGNDIIFGSAKFN